MLYLHKDVARMKSGRSPNEILKFTVFIREREMHGVGHVREICCWEGFLFCLIFCFAFVCLFVFVFLRQDLAKLASHPG